MSARIKPSGTATPEQTGRPPVRFSDEIVRRARLIQHRGGYTLKEVHEHLRAEGHDVPIAALEGWLRGTSRRFAGFPT